MSVAETGEAWLEALLMAPFIAIIFGVINRTLDLMFQSASISGNGQFAQAQESVRSDTELALSLLELASSIETWILFICFLLAVYGASRSDW